MIGARKVARPLPFARRAGASLTLAAGMVAAALGLQLLISLQPGLEFINLPLLVTVCLMLVAESPITAMLLGLVVGCAFDGLTHVPVGLHGIVYTFIGYGVSLASKYLITEHATVLTVLFGAAYLSHEGLYFGVRSALIGGSEAPHMGALLFLLVMHSGAGLLLMTTLRRHVPRL